MAPSSAIRWHSSPSGAPSTSVSTEETYSSSNNSNNTDDISKAFTSLIYKGRRGNALGLGDLRKLLQLCTSPSHINFGTQAVLLYQRKGQDFSEEVNSHFITAVAERCQAPHEAALILAKYKNRIGAWSTGSSLTKLMEALVATGDVEAVADASEQEEDVEEDDDDEAPLTGRHARTAARRAARAPTQLSTTELALTVLEVAHMKGVKLTSEICAIIQPLIDEEEPDSVEDETESVEEVPEEEEAVSAEWVAPLPPTVRQRYATLCAVIE